MKSSYFLPLLAALLITVFYLGLPELMTCPLPTDAGGRRPTRREYAAIALLTLLCAAISFLRLGDTKAPQTFRAFSDGEGLTLELAESADVARLELYAGVVPGSYEIELSADGEHWDSFPFDQNYVALLKWHELPLEETERAVRFVRVTGQSGAELGELALFSEEGALLSWAAESELTDEQALVPAEPDYLNSSYFDEIYHARTAVEHLRGLKPYEISHPPLGKLLIALGVRLFGLTPFGWRFMGTLFGVLLVPALWVFARRLFGGGAVPLCCAALTCFDFMRFTQSRIATIDSYAVFFILLMYFFFWLWLKEDDKRALALSGVCFGLGVATKWICLYAGLGLGLAWLCRWVGAFVRAKASPPCLKGGAPKGRGNTNAGGRTKKHLPPRGGKMSARPTDEGAILPAFLRNVAFCLIFFVLIPTALYCLSYLPYAAPRGVKPLSLDYFKMVLDNQRYMFTYHAGVDATHPYSSRWYEWMLDIRPILYYLHYFPDGMRSSFGDWVNPILCWAGLLGLFVLGFCGAVRRDRRAAFLLLGYLAQLVPWMFITRITFEYHYFACSLFLALALGYVFALMRDAKAPDWQTRVLGLTALSILVFVLFYPALSGEPVNNAAATKLLKWLPTWPFVRILS